MPDTIITQDITTLDNLWDRTVSSTIPPDSKLLETILEKISLECVLADISDPDSFSELLALLKEFFEAANSLKFKELADDARKAGKIVKTIMGQGVSDSTTGDTSESGELHLSCSISDIESLMDSLNLTISEMKSFLSFLIRSYDLSLPAELASPSDNEQKTLSGNIDTIKTQNQSNADQNFIKIEPEQHLKSKIETESVARRDPTIKTEVKLSATTTIHPGKLPTFLNSEDFAEFLSLQQNTLGNIELLILDIENKNNIAYAQGELKRLFHTTKGEAGFLGLKDVEKVCHKAEDLMETKNFGNIVDTLLAVKDWLEVTYSVYAGNSEHAAPSPEEIIAMFDQDQNQPEQRSSSTQPEPYCLNPSSILTESINVDASKLDRMVNIIGELAIAESIVTQSTEVTTIASATLLRSLSALHKITRELQTLGLSLRMVPLKSIFNRMARVVRDLSRKTGKEIKFIVKGESTELDKNLVDKLGDPLIHLIRNSVDHGIEENSQHRVDTGKTKIATIELRAFHKGSNLFIEVEDDGRGIDRTKLKDKAISQGIITADNAQHGDELLNLVFHPGVTTASRVTDVSGRGVGMDVVKKSIESCRGKVSISSTEGKGTTCTIKIPLTLSIIDGLVVRVSEEIYVIPTLSVVTSLKVDNKEIFNVFDKGEMIRVLGKMVPLFRLNRLLQLNGGVKDSSNGIIVVVEDNGLHTALMVDELIGKQNTVIKNLGMGMEEIKGISGGTIMPDGRVSLILDVAGIIQLSHI